MKLYISIFLFRVNRASCWPFVKSIHVAYNFSTVSHSVTCFSLVSILPLTVSARQSWVECHSGWFQDVPLYLIAFIFLSVISYGDFFLDPAICVVYNTFRKLWESDLNYTYKDMPVHDRCVTTSMPLGFQMWVIWGHGFPPIHATTLFLSSLPGGTTCVSLMLSVMAIGEENLC